MITLERAIELLDDLALTVDDPELQDALALVCDIAEEHG